MESALKRRGGMEGPARGDSTDASSTDSGLSEHLYRSQVSVDAGEASGVTC